MYKVAFVRIQIEAEPSVINFFLCSAINKCVLPDLCCLLFVSEQLLLQVELKIGAGSGEKITLLGIIHGWEEPRARSSRSPLLETGWLPHSLLCSTEH